MAAQLYHGEHDPATLPDPATIPAELRALGQWVTWRTIVRDGKATKLPLNPATGALASSTDARTWAPYSQARATAEAMGWGLGFVLTADDPYTFVDLDDAVDPATGLIAPEAERIVTELAGYTELSPSGQGVHVWIRATKPGPRCRTIGIEMYDDERFATMTGDWFSRRQPLIIPERQRQVDALYARCFPDRQSTSTCARVRVPLDLSDAELLDRMFSAKNGLAIRRLWKGDTAGYPSASEADSALLFHLAYWTDGDAARVEALARRSGLARPKWGSRRGGGTWLEQQIDRAIDLTAERSAS